MQPNDLASIQSARLDLIVMSPEFLAASLAGDRAAATQILGIEPPDEWLEERSLIRRRLDQLAEDPGELPWLVRAVVRRSDQTMLGYIGFHEPPGSAHLQPYAPGGAEIGYTICSAYRRQGYASEACAAMINWAAEQHGVPAFVLSIAPDNTPSQRIAARLGFVKVGSQIDEEDGLEEILVLRRG